MNKKLILYGEKCSTIFGKITKELEKMVNEDRLTVSTDNLCAMKKLPRWCHERGYHVDVRKIEKGKMRFTIKL
ncbi:MAG: sulfurtransferase TusA family protein [Eubacteriaceae bacterium]